MQKGSCTLLLIIKTMSAVTAYLPTVEELQHAHTKRILSIQLSTNYIASASVDSSVRIRSKSPPRLALSPLLNPTGAAFKAVALSENLDIVAGGVMLGNIIIWRLSNGEQLHLQPAHHDAILALALAGTTLVSACRDQTSMVWEVGLPSAQPFHLQLQHTLRGHSMAVLAVQICHDQIYTSAGDKSVRIWDKQSGNLVKVLETSASMAQFQVWAKSTNLQSLGACTDDIVRVFDVEALRELACLRGHTGVVCSVDIS